MTLPINNILPPVPDFQNLEESKKYLQDLTFELQNTYETTTQNVNGTIRNSVDVDGSEWIPTLKGSTTAGSFTYIFQSGWILRQGIMTDVWFNVAWSTSSGGVGTLLLELPYKVTKSNIGFRGSVACTDIPFSVGKTALVVSAAPNSFNAEFQQYGSNTNILTLPFPAPGTTGGLAGHVRYIGVEEE